MAIALGILGTGTFAHSFIPLFKAHPLVGRLVLCDRDAGKLAASAARHGIEHTVPSLEVLLASDVDAVAIFTQHWLHAPQAVAVLESGRDVYSAVPAAASMDEMAALVRTVERSGRIYMMGETSYYYPEAILCRERFRRGDFGKVVISEGEYLHDWDHGLYQVAQWRYGAEWRKRAGEWSPMQYPTHSVGMVVGVSGAAATHVSCVGIVDTKPEDHDIYSGPNRFSNQSALFRMSDGSAMRVNEMRRVGHPGAERMRIYGTEACFERSSDGHLWTTKDGVERLDPLFVDGHPELARQRARLPSRLRGLIDRGHGGSHAFLVDDFVRACFGRRQPPVHVWQAARYLLPGLAADVSSRSGAALIEVPDLGAGPAVDHQAFERPLEAAGAL
jgi:predicted dehydrogenase